MKSYALKKCLIAASVAFCGCSLLIFLPTQAWAQEETDATLETGQVAEKLRATVQALEEQVAATRKRIDKNIAAVAELEKTTTAALAERDEVLKKLKALENAKADQASVDLFAEGVKHWKILEDFPSNGGIAPAKEDGVFLMKMGDPLSGIRYSGPLDLPVTNYEFTIDARRVKGSDFFCAITFPVNDVKTCCTFVAGGWGGALAGISSLEGMDAANNDTSTFHKFEMNQWFTFRVQVTPEFLKVWMDGESIVDVELADRRVGMRWGDIEYCVPFGMATYVTAGEYRNFKICRIDGKQIEQKKEAAVEAKDNDSK
ncbi:MAG: hypothetical protein ACI9R3_001324 [Verrucomicrobiales bacterium]|jgi:hypothetical protein